MTQRLLGLMRRFWKRGLVYLVCGAVVGVGVSWVVGNIRTAGQDDEEAVGAIERDGLHLLVNTSRGRGTRYVSFAAYADSEKTERFASIFREMGARRHVDVGTAVQVPGWALSVLDEYAAGLPSAATVPNPTVAVSAVGWPFLSVKMIFVDVRGASAKGSRGLIRIGKWIFLPVLPIWGGLLINAIFYSPVPFALHWTWRAWVRHLRTSNGRCPSCGYDRRGLTSPTAACPECGAKVERTGGSFTCGLE